METKYIHFKDGTLLIFGKYIGLQHAEMARLFGQTIEDVADSGFVFFEDDQFFVYGKSLSLGVAADTNTARLISESASELKVYDLESTCRWFATNRQTEHELVGSGLDGLRKFKIL